MMLGMVAGLVGSVVSAVGAASQANAQANAMQAQADAERRKGLQEDAVKQQEASSRDRETKKVLSDQRAGFAASGGGLGGSAATVMDQTAGRGIFNREAALWEGREAKAGRENQARVYEMQASAARQAGTMNALSAVVGGVSSVFKSGGVGGAAAGGAASGGFYY